MKKKIGAQSTVGRSVMPPAIASLLREDEKVIRVATIHWGIYWKSFAFGILTLYMLFSPFFFHLGIFFSVIVVVMFSLAMLYKQFLMLVLTDKRVFLRHGIVRVDTIQIRHNRIESVETEKTIMGQLLGYAAIVIYGTGSRRTAIPFIADALAFRNDLDDMLNKYEEKSAGKDSD